MNLSAERLLQYIEPVLYGRRGLCLLLFVVASALLLWQASQIRPDASFEKNIPLDHPYMQILRQYQDDFGGANTVLVALLQKNSDIYNGRFLRQLEAATTELTFVPGIDRSRVSSLFTRNVMFIEVDEEGFAGDNIVPPDYRPSTAAHESIRRNVGKAGLVGRLVSLDHRGAMITTELLERDPVTGRPIDLVRISQRIEEQVRARFTQPSKYVYRAKRDMPEFAAGEVVTERFLPQAWWQGFGALEVSRISADGQKRQLHVAYRDLDVSEVANPQYNPEVDVHIIGFAMVVGDVAAATLEVLGFFLITVLATMLALRWYLGSTRLALLPLACALLSVVWEFGLLHLVGFGLDPFAILVPFLVMAVSTSHGVQYVNRWADELAAGKSGHEASLATFRRLFIPGTIALVTNVAGFMTIYIVPIESVREMAIHASLGMIAVLASNKILMPVWLSYLSISNLASFKRLRDRQNRRGDWLWWRLSGVTEQPLGNALIGLSLIVLAASLYLGQNRIIGDAQAGVPELRAESVYNRDVDAILGNFAIGTDVLKIIAETEADACIQFTPLEQVDRFAWQISNTPGVNSVLAATHLAKKIYSAMMENNPHFTVLPRNRYSLVLATTPIESSSGLLNYDCTAMPIVVFANDHRAETIARIAADAQRYNAQNAAEFYATHPEVSADYCAGKNALRRQLGTGQTNLARHLAGLRAAGFSDTEAREHPSVQTHLDRIAHTRSALASRDLACPVNFALGTGNLGVMAATNEVVAAAEWPALAWVYAVVLTLLLLSYRSLTGWFVIGVPLFMVSVFANALMAVWGIGLKVATLPVVTLAVGIGVDYGIYIYDVLQHKYRGEAISLREAYFQTLHETGKAVVFTGVCLAGGVAAWLFSELQFQRDMGLLLVFMFSANMLGAVLICPALCRLVLRRPGALDRP